MSAGPLRVAVAGAGYFSQFQLDGWKRIPGVELAGICDLDRARAQALAARFGVPADESGRRIEIAQMR